MTTRWPHGDPRDVVRSIEDDSRYRFNVQVNVSQRTWLDVVRDWFGNLMRAFVHRLDAAFGAHNPFEAAVGFIVIGSALALAGFGIYLLVRSALTGVRIQPRSAADSIGVSAEQTSAALLVAARAAAHARRYRDAAALLFLSAVRALDESGRITYDPARTPGEYRRLVRDPLFDAFARDAVVALFAAAEPRDDLFERMSGTYDRFFEGSAH